METQRFHPINYSRRILSWRLADRFEIGNSVAVLVEAGRGLTGNMPPTLVADSGVESTNHAIDELIDSGLLRRVLAMTEINFSNSMIEAWWRCLKHNWLFANPLDTVARLRKLVGFYVEQHNARLPHSAFNGQTPDEMYFGTGAEVPERLHQARAAARARRLQPNRALQCAACS